jgi:hypothetical protein
MIFNIYISTPTHTKTSSIRNDNKKNDKKIMKKSKTKKKLMCVGKMYFDEM